MDAETFPQEILADEEPKYLRRQKPLEIKRRKFGRKTWNSFLRVSVWVGAGLAGVWFAYSGTRFLLTAPEMQLVHPEQVGISGNHFVSRATVLETFVPDRGKSILLIPIDERRAQIESLPWVERATVHRVLPNRIEVDVVERTPVAFLREGNNMFLIDANGVVLDPPLRADFHFPVVAGIFSGMPIDERAKRMQLFESFSQQVEDARSGAMNQVSEIDLSDANDLTAAITGLQKSAASKGGLKSADLPVTVHFGSTDFGSKFTTLVDNFAQWRATAGEVDSVDLRFSREAVVNPEIAALADVPTPPVTEPALAPQAEQAHRAALAPSRSRRQRRRPRHLR
jgi:cell division protein FtsQ